MSSPGSAQASPFIPNHQSAIITFTSPGSIPVPHRSTSSMTIDQSTSQLLIRWLIIFFPPFLLPPQMLNRSIDRSNIICIVNWQSNHYFRICELLFNVNSIELNPNRLQSIKVLSNNTDSFAFDMIWRWWKLKKRSEKKRRISSGFAAVALTRVPTTRGSFIDRICARYKLTSIVWACQSCSIVERQSQWAWLTDWPAKSKLVRRSGRWILKVLHNSSMGKPFECISLIEIPSINRHNGPYAQLGEMIFEFQCNRYAAMIC